MKIDLEAYSASKQYALDMFQSNGGDINRTISNMASYRFVPCIVTAYWLGPVSNWDPKLLESIKTLIDFYGYSEIQNKPEGAPF